MAGIPPRFADPRFRSQTVGPIRAILAGTPEKRTNNLRTGRRHGSLVPLDLADHLASAQAIERPVDELRDLAEAGLVAFVTWPGTADAPGVPGRCP